MKNPDYIFETSWEVCNRVGGIYAVLSTRAASMQREHKDNVFFFGPWLFKNEDEDTRYAIENPYFTEVKSLLVDWKKQAASEGLKVRVGRWNVPGRPIAILVDYSDFWNIKNEMFGHFWDLYRVNSIEAYGDYDESSVFAYSVGVAMESLYSYLSMNHTGKQEPSVVAHFNEWQTSFALFYIKEHCPKIGTLFTTHATGIGRSIAGNNKPLYDYFTGYHGDQMAGELNMVSKHSTEKQAAHAADCFTTVSTITARECAQLLDKPVDIVTPNGFEADFVPKGKDFDTAREKARRTLKRVAEHVLGYKLKSDTLFICTSGRYEWKNKGIDAFLQGVRKLGRFEELQHQVVAFVMVPAWIRGAHKELGVKDHITTHELYNQQGDQVIHTMQYLNLRNTEDERVKVIFVPSYLNGDDGIFNVSYYDLLIGMDATVFPSYYEPWGYTPLESIAFRVPTITTDLSGFGQWAQETGDRRDLREGVAVVHRTDSNWTEMTQAIANTLLAFVNLSPEEVTTARRKAAELAEKAEWKHFFQYYREAYDIALGKV